MKVRLLVIVVLAVIAGICWAVDWDSQGQTVEPGQLHTLQNGWIVVDETTSAGDEPTDLAVGERTYTTVAAAVVAAASGDDEISIYGDSGDEARVLIGYNLVRFRCIGITDGSDADYEIYFGTLGGGSDCELAKAGTLAFVIGTQASTTSGYELADQVVVTASDWPKPFVSIGAANDTVAEAVIDMMGSDLIVVVPFTADTDQKLLMKGY